MACVFGFEYALLEVAELWMVRSESWAGVLGVSTCSENGVCPLNSQHSWRSVRVGCHAPIGRSSEGCIVSFESCVLWWSSAEDVLCE